VGKQVNFLVDQVLALFDSDKMEQVLKTHKFKPKVSSNLLAENFLESLVKMKDIFKKNQSF
jgi:hypothetical protein